MKNGLRIEKPGIFPYPFCRSRYARRYAAGTMNISSRPATTSSRSPAWDARPPRACCCSPTACATCRWTRTSRAWGCAWVCCGRGRRFEELHDQMLALTPPGQELELHVNLLRHGRRTCHARAPACGECALARMCPSRRSGHPEPPRQHREGDDRVLQRRRGEHQRVEDLVVAEHPRPRVRPAARVHDRADHVQQAAGRQPGHAEPADCRGQFAQDGRRHQAQRDIDPREQPLRRVDPQRA